MAVPMAVAGVVAWLHLDGAGDAYTRVLIAAGGEPDDVPRQVGLALGFDVVGAVGEQLLSGITRLWGHEPH